MGLYHRIEITDITTTTTAVAAAATTTTAAIRLKCPISSEGEEG